ncbi:TonB-dependent receptor [Roseateles violae]|uniref:TonB-dependent receptor n=1 Tax=Roseateles violae TaxID=3058042 RepID=A0ABT8DV47_9BURK|nr:TonB-dependent receptor [Pelomonas sp. PFR6]MDN3920779.1 TonB-dependent receptor [Pelomonas sp. PFR6]
MSVRPPAALAAACLLACACCRAENPAEVLELPQVLIIGTTPLPGSGVPLRQLPADAQVLTSREIRNQRATNITDFLDRNARGLSINAAQGNPYQPDVVFRGFSASPLLGTPQGVSVFFDGVRINEPFGDAVNWDLIPQAAISSIQLLPGSMPAFGLNTLGGAIALYTKSGASEYPERPGGSLALSGGSFGRRTLEFEGGGRRGAWDWFLSAHGSDDEGWAEHNASRVRQGFAKLGWQDEDSDLDLSLAAADNRLDGTQTLPLSFPDIRQAYTHPDRNNNRSLLLALKGSHALAGGWLLSGNAYWRSLRSQNLSSNVNEDADDEDDPPAHNDRSRIDQQGGGFGLQLAYGGKLAGLAHKASIGLSLDEGRARFTRETQPAAFSADRGTVALGEFEPETDADSRSRYWGLFLSDSLVLDPAWTLTLAGRYNRAEVRIADRSGTAPELDGQHRFGRFNPAIGLNYNPSPAWTAYAGYNEGMRAPTAIELSCADPAAPCKLPNNFLADPPLKPVISRTIEFGARSAAEAALGWSAAVFRTDLHDDLQFISSSGIAVNSGYFQNVGTTRRQGMQLGGQARLGLLQLTTQYSYVDARFISGFHANSPANSEADANGAIEVRRGDRIPSIPRHALKLRAELNAGTGWHVGANLQAASSIHARGDENNLDRNGEVPGYAVLHLDARYALSRRWQLFVRVDNTFDRRYSNFAILGENVFTGPEQSYDGEHPRAEQFRGYGAPRGAWIGLQYLLN